MATAKNRINSVLEDWKNKYSVGANTVSAKAQNTKPVAANSTKAAQPIKPLSVSPNKAAQSTPAPKRPTAGSSNAASAKSKAPGSLEDWQAEYGITSEDMSAGYNNWLREVSDFTKRVSQERTAQNGLYQQPDAIRKQRNSNSANIKYLQDQASTYRKYFVDNASLYDGNQIKNIINSLDEYGNYLSSAKNEIDNDYNFRSRFATENAYNKYLEDQAKYSGITEAPDWQTLSTPTEAKRNDNNLNVWKIGQKSGDDKYDFINNIDDYRENVRTASQMTQQQDEYGTYTRYNYISDEEAGIYNYLYAKQGKKAAEEYLDYLEETLNYRWGTAKAKEIDTTFERVMSAVPAGLDQFKSGIAQIGKEEDLPTSATQFASQAVRQKMDGGWGVVYDLVQTTSNMAPSILLSTVVGGLVGGLASGLSVGVNAASTAGKVASTVGSVVGTGTMSLSASGNAYNEKVKAGWDPDKAKTYAAIIGALEGGLQYGLNGISKLGRGVSGGVLAKSIAAIDNAAGRVAAKWGISMLSEGFEEGLQEVLEPVVFSLVFSEKYTPATLEEVAYSFMLGAMSAGLLEGSEIAQTELNTQSSGAQFHAMGDDVVQSIIDTGLESDQNTASYKVARELQAKRDAGKTITDYELGRLYGENVQTVAAEEKTQQNSPVVLDGGRVRDAVNTAAVEPAANTRTLDPAMTRQTAEVSREQSNLEAVADFAATMDKTGASVLTGYYKLGQNPVDYIQSMNTLYNLGKANPTAEFVSDISTAPLNLAQAEAAYLAGQVDAGAATRTALQEGTMSSIMSADTLTPEGIETIREDNINGRTEERNASGSRGGERTYGMAKTEPSTGISGGAKEAQAGATPQRRRAESLRAAVQTQGIVSESTIGQGIPSGTKNKTLRVVPSSLWDSSMNDVVREQRKAGRQVIFFTGKLEINDGHGGTFPTRGAISADGKRIWIRADHDTLTVEQIAKHEEFHALVIEDPDLMRRVRDRIVAKHNEAELNDMVNAYIDLYGFTDVSIDYMLEEVLADAYAGIDVFDYLTDYEGATRYTDTVRDEANRSEVSAAIDRTTGPPASGERFSPVGRTESGKPVAVIENDILSGVSKDKWVSTIKNAIRTNYPKGLQIANSTIRINAQSVKEIFYSEYSKRLKTAYPLIFKDKLRAAAQAGDVVQAAENWINEGLNHPRKDSVVAFARGDVLLRVGNSDYTAEVIVAHKSSGDMILYDVVTIKPIGNLGKIRYSAGPIRETGTESGNDYTLSTNTVSDNSIRITDEKSNTQKEKFSMERDATKEPVSQDLSAAKTSIKQIIAKGDYDYYGLRVDAIGYNVGDTASASHQLYQDDMYNDDGNLMYPRGTGIYAGYYDAGEIDGTSAIAVESDTIDRAIKALSTYNGNYIHLIAGDSVIDGVDAGEYTIKSATVLASYENISEDSRQSARENTGAGDVAFSRDTDNVGVLREQNEALRDKVDYWKGQTKRTETPTLRQGDINKLSKSLIKNYESVLDVEDISSRLKDLGEFIIRNGDGSNELTWTDVKDRATAIARDIVDNAEVLITDGENETYQAIKSYLRSTRLAYENRGEITDFNDFRKRNFGRFTISKDGLPVDVAYMELNEMFGEGYFPSSIINPSEQLMHISDLYQSMSPVYENPHSYYMACAIEYCSNDIIDGLLDESVRQTPPTFADRQAVKMVEQKAKGREQLDALRERKDARIAELRVEGREKTKQAIAKERARRLEQVSDLKEHYRMKEAKARDNRAAKALREKITQHAKDLSTKLLRPTDKKHIPESLKLPVVTLLDAINLESTFEVEYGSDGQYRRVRPGESSYAEPTKRTKAFAALKKAYSSVEIAGDLVVNPDLLGSEGVPGLLDEVIMLADIRIGDMTIPQLETVWNALQAIENSISTANKIFSAKRAATVSEVAEALRRDNSGKTARGEVKYIGKLLNLATTDMLTPEAFYHRMGDSGDVMFRMMRDAQDEHILIMKAASDFTHNVMGNVSVKELENELHTVTLGGEQAKLSTAQLMELYALSRREQALNHILRGGILPAPVSGKGLVKITRANPIRRITMQEISNAVSLLTAEQVQIAEKLQNYLSTDMSEYGNRASMAVYNVRKFLEKFYWPIRTNRQEIRSDVQKDTATISIPQRGFTKSTIPNADTSVMVGSIFDTFSSHVTEMATYAAWLGPSVDINRIINYSFRNELGERVGSVKQIVENVHGAGKGTNYLLKLFKDISNGVKGTHGETDYMGGITSNYKAAAVGANLRVILQQPTAILRALDMIDAKYLAGGMIPNNGWQKAMKYAPIAQWKDWGYFDINTGRQMKDVLFESDSILEKAKQASMWLAGKADSVAWGQLWNACELEAKDTRKDLTPGTEPFYKAVAERFTEIIDRTQVVDGILQRSQIMRSSNGIHKMATSFMGEPTKQYNMFLSAVYDARNAKTGAGQTKAKKRLARTLGALLISGAVNAAVQSIVDAARDDDKEKNYWEKWLESFIGFTGEEETVWQNFRAFWNGTLESVINPAQYLPYVKDVASLLHGYDVSRMDMESIDKTISATIYLFNALSGEGKVTVAAASANLFAEASRLLGLPVANIKRDLQAVVTTIAAETGNYLMQYRMEKALLNMNYTGNSRVFLDILYQASINDKAAYKLIYADLIKSGFDADKIATGMESRMKKDQGVTSAGDLKSRYLAPEQQAAYDRSASQVERSDVWKKADAEQQDDVMELLYGLASGSNDAASRSAREKISGGAYVGLSQEEYLLYKLALSIADKPTESGNYGSYTNAETEDAIRMLKDMTNAERDYLWVAQGKNENSTPIW